jgi:hypothetical protein
MELVAGLALLAGVIVLFGPAVRIGMLLGLRFHRPLEARAARQEGGEEVAGHE